MGRVVQNLVRRFFGRRIFPHRGAWILDLALRRLILSPEKLADRLHLTPSLHALEVGPGSGYFSVAVARRIPEGHLELLDVQPEMLEKVRRKIAAAGLRNVGYTQGDACDLPFADGRFDMVFMVGVLGELADPGSCLWGIRHVLRGGGLLSITEQLPDPDFSPLASVCGLAEAHRFEFIESFGHSWAYTANFRKPADAT